MKRKTMFCICFVVCLCLIGCSSNTPKSSDNSKYKNARGINLLYEYDMQSKTWTGSYYQLKLSDDKCTLIYHEKNSLATDLYCDFSIDVFNEVLSLICSQNPEEYEYQTDSNGKIIYETIPCIIELFFSGYEKNVFLKDPINFDEIIAKFESLKAAAIQ
ncbi:MAG: hypothetical protein IJK86_08315 [Lachnospiraceae bacterium]|nr:hypothetical protein [Lachnospiraceae bacterium]